MEPGTLETSLETAKVGLMLAGVAGATLVGTIGSVAGIYKLMERMHERDQLMPLYEKGRLARKPNIFNVYKF